MTYRGQKLVDVVSFTVNNLPTRLKDAHFNHFSRILVNFYICCRDSEAVANDKSEIGTFPDEVYQGSYIPVISGMNQVGGINWRSWYIVPINA